MIFELYETVLSATTVWVPVVSLLNNLCQLLTIINKKET